VTTAAHAVQVWLARESQLDDPAIFERCRALMTPDERERRFLADGPRRLNMLARSMQRCVLATLLSAAPGELRFDLGGSGRPSLAAPWNAAGLDFNLAHTRGLVVLAVTRDARLGVDVEENRDKVPLAAARRYFSAAEVESLDALPAAMQPRRFLRLWTLKEAYLKAIGTGIAGGLGSMTFRVDAGAPTFERASDPGAPHWSFAQFDVDGHLLALACHAAGRAIDVDWREFTGGDSVAPAFRIRASGEEQAAEA